VNYGNLFLNVFEQTVDSALAGGKKPITINGVLPEDYQRILQRMGEILMEKLEKHEEERKQQSELDHDQKLVLNLAQNFAELSMKAGNDKIEVKEDRDLLAERAVFTARRFLEEVRIQIPKK
jgi:hypothetical protein